MLENKGMTPEELVLDGWDDIPESKDIDFTPTREDIDKMRPMGGTGEVQPSLETLRTLLNLFKVRWDGFGKDNAKIRRLFSCWERWCAFCDLPGCGVMVEAGQPISGRSVGDGKICYAAIRGDWPVSAITEDGTLPIRAPNVLPDIPFRYFLNKTAPDGMELVDSRDERFWSDWTEVDGFLELIADKRLIWYATASFRPKYDAAIRKVLGKKAAI